MFGPPGDLNLVDTFYHQFLLFADSAMLMGFKLSEQIFEDPGLEPVVGVGIPYGRSVSYCIHKIKI